MGRRLEKERAPAHTSRRCGRGPCPSRWRGVGGSDLALWAETRYLWGRGGVLDRVSAAPVPRRLCSSRCWTAGWVVVTALVCGVARAVLVRAGPRQLSATQY